MITGKSYLTRSLLNKIYERELTTDEIEDLVLSGELIKQFSYYQASEALLRKLGVIPNTVKIALFNILAKKSAFVLRDFLEIFNCNIDTAKLIAKKYFDRRWNYYYKNDILINYVSEGVEELDI